MVLSKRFFEKGWPQYELDGLVTLSVTGKQILLPVWHEITAAELIEFSPSLADRVALDTSRHAIEAIADEIADVVESEREQHTTPELDLAQRDSSDFSRVVIVAGIPVRPAPEPARLVGGLGSLSILTSTFFEIFALIRWLLLASIVLAKKI